MKGQKTGILTKGEHKSLSVETHSNGRPTYADIAAGKIQDGIGMDDSFSTSISTSTPRTPDSADDYKTASECASSPSVFSTDSDSTQTKKQPQIRLFGPKSNNLHPQKSTNDKNNSNQKADDLDAHPSPQRNDPGNSIVADSEPENKNGTGAIKDDAKIVDNVKEICSLVRTSMLTEKEKEDNQVKNADDSGSHQVAESSAALVHGFDLVSAENMESRQKLYKSIIITVSVLALIGITGFAIYKLRKR